MRSRTVALWALFLSIMLIIAACGGAISDDPPAPDAGPIAVQSAPLATLWTQTLYQIPAGQTFANFQNVGDPTTQICGPQGYGATNTNLDLGTGIDFHVANGTYFLQLAEDVAGQGIQVLIGCAPLSNFTSSLGHALSFDFPSGRGLSLFNNASDPAQTSDWYCFSGSHYGPHGDGVTFSAGSWVLGAGIIQGGINLFPPNRINSGIDCLTFDGSARNIPNISAPFPTRYNPAAQRGAEGGPCTIPGGGGSTNTICNYLNGFTEANSFCTIEFYDLDNTNDLGFHSFEVTQTGSGQTLAIYTSTATAHSIAYNLGNQIRCLPYILN